MAMGPGEAGAWGSGWPGAHQAAPGGKAVSVRVPKVKLAALGASRRALPCGTEVLKGP